MRQRDGYADAACFRLSRLIALMDEAGVTDYRRWSRSQIEAAIIEVKCTLGRDRFRDGVRRHAEWLRSLSYEQYLQTTDWAVVRYFALRRAGYRCEDCGRGRGLEAHHETYDRRCEERLSDMKALCPACHARSHPEMPARDDWSRSGLRTIDFAGFAVGVLDQASREESGDGSDSTE